jgi:preprotein translocase subunit Sss1
MSSKRGGVTLDDLVEDLPKSRRIFGRLSKPSAAFLSIAIIETVAILIAEVVGMIVYGGGFTTGGNRLILKFFYNPVVIITQLIFLFFVVDALLNENRIQLIASMLISLVLVARLIYGFISGLVQQTGFFVDDLISLIVGAAAQVAYTILVYFVWISFGPYLTWLVIDSKLKRLYTRYEIFRSAVLIDLQFTIIIAYIGFFLIVFTWYAYMLLGLGLAFSMFMAPLVIYVGIYFESYVICIIYFLWGLALPGYFIYKNVYMYRDCSIAADNEEECLRTFYGFTNRYVILATLTVATAISCLWRFFVLAWTIVMMVGFRKGLKPNVWDKQRKSVVDAVKISTRKHKEKPAYDPAVYNIATPP